MSKEPKQAISISLVSLLLRVLDGCAFVVVAIATFYFYLSFRPEVLPEIYVTAGTIGLLVQQNAFHFMGVYQKDCLFSFEKQISRISAAHVIAFFAMISIAFFVKVSGDFSRVWGITWFAASWFLIIFGRIVFRAVSHRWIAEGRLERKVVIVGGGDHGQQVVEYIKDENDRFYNILGFFDDRTDRVPNALSGVPKLGNVLEALTFARNNHVDIVLIALPWSAETRILSLVKSLSELSVDIRLSPEATGRTLTYGGFTEMAGLPVVRLLDKPFNEWQYLLKEAEDKVLATLAIVVFGPLMLLVGIIIKLDSPGPVFFRQKRFGRNNNLIEVLKFRSMYDSAADEKAERLTQQNDVRVTKVGRFLRKSSIDELPQILNVLMGQMSMVGPRPHAVAAKAADRLYFDVMEEYASRHRIKPGITGWAQVNGFRGNTDTEEKLRRRVEHDLYYIEHWSLWFDLKILVMTIVEVFRSRNAY